MTPKTIWALEILAKKINFFSLVRYVLSSNISEIQDLKSNQYEIWLID